MRPALPETTSWNPVALQRTAVSKLANGLGSHRGCTVTRAQGWVSALPFTSYQSLDRPPNLWTGHSFLICKMAITISISQA